MTFKPPIAPNVAVDRAHVYDEATSLPVRAGLKFLGTGVTATDDANNDATIVTIPGLSAGSGGEPFTAVDTLSGTPRSVTDWGTLINTAITAGTRRFLFGPYDYPFTTMIDARQLQGLIFQGAGGWDWYDPGRTDGNGKETGHTRLIWGGTGTGFAIDLSSVATGANGNTGPVFEDMMILYSSGSYTGKLINFKNSTMAAVNRCYFGFSQGNVLGGSGTAACALSLDGVNTIDVADTTFDANFGYAVRGRESGGAGYSNVARFREVTFTGRALANPGLDWQMTHCIFELQMGVGEAAVTTDFNYTGDQIQLTLKDCAYWDAPATGQTVVREVAGNEWAFAAHNCNDHNSVSSLTKLYDLASSGSVEIIGGNTRNPVDVGDGSSLASRKRFVYIENFDIDSTSSKTDRLLNVNTGHGYVHVAASIGGTNLNGVSGQVKTLSHERIGLGVDDPTIASHAGVLNQTVEIYGNDNAGFILIANTGGGAGPTGLVADVTLATNIASHNIARAIANTRQIPVVMFTPFSPTSGGIWNSPTAGAFYTVKPEAVTAPVSTDANAMKKFNVYFNTGLPAGQVVGIAYRVVHH